jgi:hypothetical protein
MPRFKALAQLDVGAGADHEADLAVVPAFGERGASSVAGA